MKIRCLQDCNGIGYEHFKKGQEREIQDDLANVLIQYAYAERIEPAKDQKREALIKQFNDLGLIGEAEKMDTHIIEDCIKTYLYRVEQDKLIAEEKAKLEAGEGQTPKDEASSDETEEEKRAKLISRAKELGVKGVLENFKDETLEKKIAEAEEAAK